MTLTHEETKIILEAIRKQYGFGYSDIPEVGKLQAKLSINLEMTAPKEESNDS